MDNFPSNITLCLPKMDEKKFVTYQGIKMIEGWPERIKQAQKQHSYIISGKKYSRIPYGDEDDDWEADTFPCHECRVLKGQFHVVSCDVEQCPLCRGQALSCDCKFEFTEEE